MNKNEDLEVAFAWQVKSLYTVVKWLYDHVTEYGFNDRRWGIYKDFAFDLIDDRDIEKLLDLYEKDEKELVKEIEKIVNKNLETDLEFNDPLDNFVYRRISEEYGFDWYDPTICEECDN